MRIRKIDVINSLMVTCFTPISIFTLFLSILKNSKLSVFLLSLFMALISYSYKPYLGYDKTRHFGLYEYIQPLSFYDFWSYIALFSPDFFFYLVLYCGGKIGLSFHHVVFLCTFVTTFLIFSVVNDEKRKMSGNIFNNIAVSILMLCSIYYLDVLSGMRFYLAAAFFIYGLHLLSHRKILSAFVFLIFSIITHFSILLVTPLYFLYFFTREISLGAVKFLIILSLLLSLLSSYYMAFFSSFGFGGALDHKMQAYLTYGDTIVQEHSFARKIFDFTNIVWFYILNIACIFSLKKYKGFYFKMMVVTLCVANIFIAFPSVFTRYALLVRVFLVLFLIENFFNTTYKIKYLFIVLLILSTISQIIVIAHPLLDALFPNLESIFFIFRLINEPYSFEDID